jgi:hypothetical protein
MKSNIEYEPLSGGTSLGVPKKKHDRRWYALSFGIGCATTLAIIAILLAIQGSITPDKIETKKTAEQIEAEDWNYCGRSSDAARARGCVMEPMFYGWMPARCVFRELTDSLPVFEDRTYYSDENMTQKLLPEQLWAGEYKIVYTPQ